MSPISRRELLGGLITTAVAANVGRKDSEKPKHTESSPLASKLTLAPSPARGLNVILHGLMAVGVSTSGSNPKEAIRVVVPEHVDSPEHVYRVGSMIRGLDYSCTTIPCNAEKHWIQGLRSGQVPDLSNRSTDFVVPAGSNTIDETGCRIFLLPWPKQLLSVRKTFIKPDSGNCESKSPLISVTSGPQDHNSRLTSLSIVHILQYDCDEMDAQGPRIVKSDGSTLTWQPNYMNLPLGCTTIPTANLHIFGEPIRPVTQAEIDHVRMAFKKLLSVIRVNGTTLESKYNFNVSVLTDIDYCSEPATACYPGVEPLWDLRTLPEFRGVKAGEMANCLKGLVSLS